MTFQYLCMQLCSYWLLSHRTQQQLVVQQDYIQIQKIGATYLSVVCHRIDRQRQGCSFPTGYCLALQLDLTDEEKTHQAY